MRQRRMYSITQTHTYTPDKDILQETRTPITIRRASRFTSFILGFAFGIGVLVLLALLSTWLSPSTRATARSAMSTAQAEVWTLSSSAVEELGMSPTLFEDPFARL